MPMNNDTARRLGEITAGAPMTAHERLADIRELIEQAKTYTPEENADLSYWPGLYEGDVQWLLGRATEQDVQVATLRAALERLEEIAGVYAADQTEAPDVRCGLVQPISVPQGDELNAALDQAAAALSSTPEAPR